MTGKEFIDVYMPLRNRLFGLAYHFLGSSSDAEDLLQDVYLKLWNMRDDLECVTDPLSYCMTMTRNLCLDRIRRMKHSSDNILPEDLTDGDDMHRRLEAREEIGLLSRELDRLSESQWTVLRMKVLEGLSYKEISERTGMNNLTLRVLLSQARKKVKKSI